MLVSPREQEIVAKAWEPGIRRPDRAYINFMRFLKHFLRDKNLAEKTILDLGPGHYDFGILARFQGARVIPLELDPAVIELGRYRGFEPIEFDLKRPRFVESFGKQSIDGIFCNGSIDASWWTTMEEQIEYARDLYSCLRPDGWALIAPCNSGPEEIGSALDNQRQQISAFKELGFKLTRLTKLEKNYFGISTNILPAFVLTKNVRYVRFPWLFR